MVEHRQRRASLTACVLTIRTVIGVWAAVAMGATGETGDLQQQWIQLSCH
jgi:hypothetical protein